MSEVDTRQAAVRVEALDGGAIWRVVLNSPRANILDMEKTELLRATFKRAAADRELKAVLIEGQGDHFCFGASVEEHLPDTCESMIRGFHALFDEILDANVITLAAVRGHCLGGALELAGFCNRVFAAPDAHLGQPEIVLGVFPPVASVTLVERVGRGAAEDLCLSGRSLGAEEAHRLGLVDQIADDPSEVALGYARKYLLRHSASSLRIANRALRAGFARRFRAELREVERLYLDDLMSTADAREGLQAFLDKRDPQWTDE